VDLGQVLHACRQALQQQQQQDLSTQIGEAQICEPEGLKDSDFSSSSSSSSSSSRDSDSVEARQLAAQLLRTWVCNSTFSYVEGVRAYGPTWALKGRQAGAQGTEEVSQQAVGV
jgi:hypothetical protein